MAPETGAVVVAAGLSMRMRAFKPLLPLGGSTIIRTAVATLSASGCRPIVLVCGHRADELREHVADLEIDCRINPEYASGDMFRSACIGLAALPGRCRRAFFLPGDVPLFSSGSLQAMTAAMEQTGAWIVVPAWRGRKGHPVLLDMRAIPGLLAYRGDRGLKGAITASRHPVAVLELDDPGLVMDADSPGEYRRLLRYRKKAGAP